MASYDGLLPTATPSVITKRDGSVATFEISRIRIAIEKAFRAESRLATDAALPADLLLIIAALTSAVSDWCTSQSSLHVEQIQDKVEQVLMAAGEYAVARRYVLYREDHARRRVPPPISVRNTDGTYREFDYTALANLLAQACTGLCAEASPKLIHDYVIPGLYDGISDDEILQSCIMAARSLVELEPDYRFATARLLLHQVYKHVLPEEVTLHDAGSACQKHFGSFIKTAIDGGLLHEDLLKFDLNRLGSALRTARDLNFAFIGLQTLVDRYFLKLNDTTIETPQYFWMRIAMGLAINESNPNEQAIEFYEVMSQFKFTPATPTLFNSGTRHPQLSSCYLTTIPDDLCSIFKCIQDNALLSKWAGGLGNDWTSVRALGSKIEGTGGRSQGIIPFLKVANDTAAASAKEPCALTWKPGIWTLKISWNFAKIPAMTDDEHMI
jgi:ribonucleoside-diphosphate reductase alpha chain